MASSTSAIVKRFFAASLPRAAALQRRWASHVVEEDSFGGLRTVAGADVAYDPATGRLFAAVGAFDARRGDLVESASFEGPVQTPYVPGFLSFREGPALVAAIAQLRRRPDILLCDGHGRAHPRRFGLACHLGLALDIPSIGVGKSLLVGKHRRLGPGRGSAVRLVHQAEVIGLAVRTRDGVKPIFVSVGHRVSLATARRLVLRWSPRFRIPEPIRWAHHEVSRRRAAARARRKER